MKTGSAMAPWDSPVTEMHEELEALRRRLMELEELEVMRVTEEQDRFNSLQVLDEYAKELEASRDKLARLLKASADVQEAKSVQAALERIAQAVGQAGWGSVSVTLFEEWEIVQSAYYGCTPEDIEFLESHRRPPDERARFFGPDCEKFKVSRSYFVPADFITEVAAVSTVVPGRRPVQPGDSWNPMDLAYVPLYGSEGRIIGCINCDDPQDGRRPSSERFFYLELFADFAARKVETAKLIEQQKRTEDALKRSELSYRTVFSRSEDGLFILDGDIFRECNRKACEIWRCQPEDIIGKTPMDFSPELQPDGRASLAAAQAHIQQALAGEPQSFNWQHRRHDGTLVDCDVSLSPLEMEGETRVLAIVRDNSERRRAELERETMLRILQIANAVESQDEMVPAIFREIGKLVPIENYYLALYDRERELLSFPYFKDEKDPAPQPFPPGRGLTGWIIRQGQALRLGPDDFERLRQSGEVELRGTPALSWLGVPLTGKQQISGALVVQSYHQEQLYSDTDERMLVAIASQIAMVLDRKRAEQELHRSQEMLAEAGKMAHVGAWEIEFSNGKNINDNPLRWSAEVFRIFGYEPGSVPVTNDFFFSRVHPDDREKITQIVAEALRERRSYALVHRIIRSDGEIRIVEEHAELALDEAGRPLRMIGAVQDITARVRTEQAFPSGRDQMLATQHEMEKPFDV